MLKYNIILGYFHKWCSWGYMCSYNQSHQFMLAYKKYKYRCQLSKDHMGWSSCGSLKLWRPFQ